MDGPLSLVSFTGHLFLATGAAFDAAVRKDQRDLEVRLLTADRRSHCSRRWLSSTALVSKYSVEPTALTPAPNKRAWRFVLFLLAASELPVGQSHINLVPR